MFSKLNKLNQVSASARAEVKWILQSKRIKSPEKRVLYLIAKRGL